MKCKVILSGIVFILSGACVDRITFDVGDNPNYPIVVDGYISDQPGPYTIALTKSFDIESKISLKTPISAKRVEIFDDQGYSEVLTPITQGVYQTDPAGIKGVIGRAYHLRVELLDGRVYESTPDTLLASGFIDNVYHNFRTTTNSQGATSYGFDVLFDSNTGENGGSYFLWSFIGTYQVDTNPELFKVSCGESKCPKPLACSSYVLGTSGLEYVKPCECCTCWVDFYNDIPIVNDDQLVKDGKFISIKAGYVPVNQWTFLHKVHAEVQQRSLSRQAFNFWRAVKAQKSATSSIFQPISGKIRSNFIQITGQQIPMEGLFYATSIVSKSIFITPNDLPRLNMIPSQDLPFENTCMELFPFSTTQKPQYWD